MSKETTTGESGRGKYRTDDELRREIGQRLKQARHNTGKIAEQMAEACDVSVQTIFNWERGRQFPSVEHLNVIAAELDIRIDWLLGRTAEPEGADEVRMVEAYQNLPRHRQLIVRQVAEEMYTISVAESAHGDRRQ